MKELIKYFNDNYGSEYGNIDYPRTKKQIYSTYQIIKEIGIKDDELKRLLEETDLPTPKTIEEKDMYSECVNGINIEELDLPGTFKQRVLYELSESEVESLNENYSLIINKNFIGNIKSLYVNVDEVEYSASFIEIGGIKGFSVENSHFSIIPGYKAEGENLIVSKDNILIINTGEQIKSLTFLTKEYKTIPSEALTNVVLSEEVIFEKNDITRDNYNDRGSNYYFPNLGNPNFFTKNTFEIEADLEYKDVHYTINSEIPIYKKKEQPSYKGVELEYFLTEDIVISFSLDSFNDELTTYSQLLESQSSCYFKLNSLKIVGKETVSYATKEFVESKIVGVKNSYNGEIFNDYRPLKLNSSNNVSQGNRATGNYSHAEGTRTTASGDYSHAEGYETDATGNCSHSEGSGTIASSMCSHAEGLGTTVSGEYSHAEGYKTKATNQAVHAEGYYTQANGYYSHAEGCYTQANGLASHAEGYYTQARSSYQHVQGKYNKVDTDSKYLHIVGNGTDENNRSNAHTIDTEGNAWFSGKLSQEGTPTEDKDLATKKYVDDNSGGSKLVNLDFEFNYYNTVEYAEIRFTNFEEITEYFNKGGYLHIIVSTNMETVDVKIPIGKNINRYTINGYADADDFHYLYGKTTLISATDSPHSSGDTISNRDWLITSALNGKHTYLLYIEQICGQARGFNFPLVLQLTDLSNVAIDLSTILTVDAIYFEQCNFPTLV